MNKVILIGNLTRDPETATTQSGMTYCKFAIAVNRRGKDKGVDYINIIAWNKTAELCGQYLAKGRKVAISGSISTGSYENKDGNKVYTTDVMADEVEFLTPNSEQKAEPKTAADHFKAVEVTDEDLPF